jgi:hypothetical protein
METQKKRKKGRLFLKVVIPILGILIAISTLVATIYVRQIQLYLGLIEEPTSPPVGQQKADTYFETETLFLFSANQGNGQHHCEGKLLFNAYGLVLYVYACPDNKKYYEIGVYEIIDTEVHCNFMGQAVVVDSNFYTHQTDISMENSEKKHALILKKAKADKNIDTDYTFTYKKNTYSCKSAHTYQIWDFKRMLREEGSYPAIQELMEAKHVIDKSYARIF